MGKQLDVKKENVQSDSQSGTRPLLGHMVKQEHSGCVFVKQGAQIKAYVYFFS